MHADEYRKLALRTTTGKATAGQSAFLKCAEGSNLPTGMQRLNWALGLPGEAGEYRDLVKKQVFHDWPVDKKKMLKELGDVACYLAVAAHEAGFSLGEVMAANIQKLLIRYPGGFSTAASRDRVE